MKIAIGVIIAIIIIGGGIWWFTQSDSTTNINSGTNTALTNTSSDAETIQALMEKGDPVTCTFALSDTNGIQSWTMYVDGERVRGDYEVTSTEEDAWEGHIITDTEWHYNWGNYQGTTYGTKLKLEEYESETTTEDTIETAGAQEVDYSQQVDMDCDSWSVVESVFTPPSDVTFTDLSAQMEQMESLTNDLKATQCAACDDTGDPETCKSALGC